MVHQMVMRLLEIQFFTRSKRKLTNPLGNIIILPLAIVPMVLAVAYQTQTGAAVIVLCGFFALFVGSYRWAVRRARWPAYRRSRKLSNS